MKELNSNAFTEMSNDELMIIDGGFGVSITVALIGLAGTCFVAGLAAGAAAAQNRKNREQPQP